MIELKGPFRGRLPIRINLSFSSRLSRLFVVVVAVVREYTAGTADRCASILAEVNSAGAYREIDLRARGNQISLYFGHA